MNSRIREPLIWPPNRNDTSKLMSSDCIAVPSVASTARIAQPMRCAAWNMVGAFSRVSRSPVCGSSSPSVSVDSTDWLIARFAEDMEFAKGRDVVEAGIGTGVRDHDQTVPHQHSATIGHFRSPNASDGARNY